MLNDVISRILGGMLCLGATPVLADLSQVQRQIESLQREIEAEKQILQTDLARQSAGQRASSSRLEDMRNQTRRARFEADSLRRILAAQGRPGQSQVAEQARLQDWNKRFSLALADQVDTVLAKLMREELPHYAEPKERRLRDLSRGLRTGVLSPDQGLGQALDELSEILAWASKAEAVAGSYVTSAGAPMNGFYVRVGGIFEGFVSEDGKMGAYRLRNESGWQWKESLTAERRDNLLKISRMILSGEQPGFVPIPFGMVSGGMP